MILSSVFFLTVFLYSLFSKRLERTIITAPIMFTMAGIALVVAMPNLREMDVERANILKLAELGLVMLLFTDAVNINLKTLRSRGKLPLRLLTVGMLLTVVLGAVAAVSVFPVLTIWEAGILAAILAPTDAGLGQVIVQSPRVPVRIAQALNVEAGLNDGLSVPFLMFFIAVAQAGTEGAGTVLFRYIGEQLGMGAVVGLLIGLGGGWLLGYANNRGWMSQSVQQFALVTLPIFTILACKPVGGSMFIAAYVAGLVVRVGFRDAAVHSIEFAEGWGQLFDYFIFFFFGLVTVFSFGHFGFRHLLYGVLSLTLVRMLPVAVSLIRSRLSKATVIFMGWFGPRGLASIVLGLVFLEEEVRLPGEETIRLAVIMTVMLSIFAHGLSALPGIGWYARRVAALGAVAPEKQQ
jgi:NhaP-type Na+/H+ or K+/H+ antiporter